ncbi:uncharacterized protein DAT39_022327 [Clarias magur]|uniref:Integrase core domain-containing protein n=1 Tax=Clarias magur TaxID=1594786 RepID=A0A8J4WNZ2_CLAMG|nr:uncharacterized protein DAT39_022327 [Clarias magur]
MGTENSSIRDIQRSLRQNDVDLQSGERSFIYGRSTSNQRIESWWGILRTECVEFWLEQLHSLKNEGVLNGEFLDKDLIIFCFLGIIQTELDAVKESWNSHLIRPSRNQRVPHGRPEVMYFLPELYNTQDYLCQIAEPL